MAPRRLILSAALGLVDLSVDRHICRLLRRPCHRLMTLMLHLM